MRERKNDPVLIGFHENLLLNNGNLLSTLGSIEWERASDCFVWVEAWVLCLVTVAFSLNVISFTEKVHGSAGYYQVTRWQTISTPVVALYFI